MVVKFKELPPVDKPLRLSVRTIIVNDDKVILAKHLCKHTGNLKAYDLPGGGVDPEETLEDAVIKECLEEVGIRVKNVTPLGLVVENIGPMYNQTLNMHFAGNINHYFKADLDCYDSTLFNIEGDGMAYIEVSLDEAIDLITNGPEDRYNEARLQALEKLKVSS